MHKQKIVFWSVVGFLALSAFAIVIVLNGQHQAEQEVPLLGERRFFQSGDEALINTARNAISERYDIHPEDVSLERTAVVLKMQQLNCIKFDLDPPGIGRDYSVCLDARDGSIIDYGPVSDRE